MAQFIHSPIIVSLTATDCWYFEFQDSFLGSTQYPESVATTWLVTIQRLGPLARSILTLIGFLAPDDIPRSIVTEAGDFLREGVLEMQPVNEQVEIETSAYAMDQEIGRAHV